MSDLELREMTHVDADSKGNVVDTHVFPVAFVTEKYEDLKLLLRIFYPSKSTDVITEEHLLDYLVYLQNCQMADSYIKEWMEATFGTITEPVSLPEEDEMAKAWVAAIPDLNFEPEPEMSHQPTESETMSTQETNTPTQQPQPEVKAVPVPDEKEVKATIPVYPLAKKIAIAGVGFIAGIATTLIVKRFIG